MRSNVRAFLITNPKAGRGSVDLSEAIAVLQAHGWEVAVRQKLRGGHATELARDAVRDGYNVVVDCGGDGTLNEIVEGVAGTGAAVGVIPGGTANLWAHEAGISPSPQAAALQLVGAEQHRVDVGRVAVNGHHKRHFLLMAGLGFDGAVLRELSKPLKKRVGWLAYAPATIRALRAFRPVPVDVDMDGVQWHGHTTQIVVANTRRYAGFTRMCPRAYMDDGLLDICLLTPDSVADLGRQMSALVFHQRPSATSTQEHRAAAITIRSPELLPLEVDGGVIHLTDNDLTPEGVVYTFTLTAQGVSVLTPRTYDGALFEPRRFADALADIPLQPIVTHILPQAREHNGLNGHTSHTSHTSHNGHSGHTDHNGSSNQNISTVCRGHIEPVRHSQHSDRDKNSARMAHEQRDGKKAKVKVWQMRILSVGIDSLTVAYVKNGRVVRVEIPSETVLAGAGAGDEADQSLWGALSRLTEGDLVEIEGMKDRKNGVLLAQKVALPERALALKANKHAHKQ